MPLQASHVAIFFTNREGLIRHFSVSGRITIEKCPFDIILAAKSIWIECDAHDGADRETRNYSPGSYAMRSGQDEDAIRQDQGCLRRNRGMTRDDS